MKKFLKILFGLSPIAVVILAYIFTGIYKFQFKYIGKDSVGEFNVALYSAGLMLLINFIEAILVPSTSIDLEFSSQKGVYNSSEIISCPFKSDIATVYLCIKLTGNPKTLATKKIRLFLPPDVTAQPIKEFADYYKLTHKESCLEIDMKNFFNTNRKTFLEREGKEISFKVIKSRDDVNSLISSELNKKSKVNFIANKIRLTR